MIEKLSLTFYFHRNDVETSSRGERRAREQHVQVVEKVRGDSSNHADVVRPVQPEQVVPHVPEVQPAQGNGQRGDSPPGLYGTQTRVKSSAGVDFIIISVNVLIRLPFNHRQQKKNYSLYISVICIN